jgi:hypothetical protein
MNVSCHRPFLPVTSLEPAVNPTAQASSFTLPHTAVLSVLCVIFQVQLSFVVKLSNVIIIIIIICLLFACFVCKRTHK